ncbi:MAG: sulfurtransferase [Betaproteobacteria bacterium]|nr:sulfurtransferase [Betaproteobacteria bacterium]MDH5219988.1 sulfurtransferase [Betaproteobacteria bacterium]MDH5350662.1 sulfurtransferase [Betaproteobacteria bacterium]
MLSTLVSTEELARHPEWRRFDCRHDLMKPELGREQYAGAHIPGAAFAHLDHDLSAPKTGKNGRHPLPDPAKFIAWLGAKGLKPSDEVVCYDGGSGAMAARLWWMLRWVGHEAVAVLDGGLAKWTKEGRPVTAEVPKYPATVYSGKPRADMAVDVSHVVQHLGKESIVDARAAARWRGEAEPIDPEAGRIPGSLNRFNGANLTLEGVHKPAAQLRAEFEVLLAGRKATEVVHSCGSGVAACHNLLAMEVAGLKGGKLYAGSWSEWIADPARPRERG